MCLITVSNLKSLIHAFCFGGNNNIIKDQIYKYKFQVNQPTVLSSQNCPNLNLIQFQMTYRSQDLQKNVSVSYKSFLQTAVHQVFPLLGSLASDIFLYGVHRTQVADENFFRGLHVRSVGCFTCHVLKMLWSDSLMMCSPHLSRLSLLACPMTSQEIKKMSLKLAAGKNATNCSNFNVPHYVSDENSN